MLGWSRRRDLEKFTYFWGIKVFDVHSCSCMTGIARIVGHPRFSVQRVSTAVGFRRPL